MTSSEHGPALAEARKVYADFLEVVVRQHVYGRSERDLGSGSLEEQKRQAIDNGRKVDNRAPYLATVSGKGGWHEDPEKREAYARFTNVSLLDHLASVVRGSLVFAAMDLLAAGTHVEVLPARLATVAAVAFLHDADKMLGIGREVEITEGDVAELMVRYGIHRFLSGYGVVLSPAAAAALIDEVETTRAGRIRPGDAIVDRETRRDTIYVRLADRMDSGFQDSSIPRADILARPSQIDGLRSDALRHGWKVLEIRDPLHPFLLEEFCKAIDRATEDMCGHPALLAVHHDGVLTGVVPEVRWQAIVSEACSRLGRFVSGGEARVTVSNRGFPDILDKRPTLNELKSVVGEMSSRDRRKLLYVRLQDLKEFAVDIAGLLGTVDAGPRLPVLDGYEGKLVPMEAGEGDDWHARAALASLLLQCTDDDKGLGIPDVGTREGELLALLTEAEPRFSAPEWLASLGPMSRRSILSVFAAGAAGTNDDLDERLFRPGGLCSIWLEGAEGRPGIRAKIVENGSSIAGAVVSRFESLLSGKPIVVADREGRCHFTNEPVGKESRIDGKTGLYAVNVSAFSGREGRPEFVDRTKSETLVSAVSQAEHRLRQVQFGKPGSSDRSVAVTISSPTSSGLFASLAHPADGNLEHWGLTDLLKEDAARVDKHGFDEFTKRVALARYEEMPTQAATIKVDGKERPGQLAFARMVLEVSMRFGRPLHVFRGLPRQTGAYVAFDFLPAMAEQAIGGLELRLEQVRPAIAALTAIDAIAKRRGMGAALAAEAADPATRFAAMCSVLDRLERSESETADVSIRRYAINQLQDGGCAMGTTDKAFVNFGKAMALLQRAPTRNDGINVSEVGLRIAIEAAENLAEIGQTSRDSVLAAVSGCIKREFERSSLFASKESRRELGIDDAIDRAATVFVDEIWFGALGGVAPSSRTRRTCFAVYRWSFTQEAYARLKDPSRTAADDDVAA